MKRNDREQVFSGKLQVESCKEWTKWAKSLMGEGDLELICNRFCEKARGKRYEKGGMARGWVDSTDRVIDWPQVGVACGRVGSNWGWCLCDTSHKKWANCRKDWRMKCNFLSAPHKGLHFIWWTRLVGLERLAHQVFYVLYAVIYFKFAGHKKGRHCACYGACWHSIGR